VWWGVGVLLLVVIAVGTVFVVRRGTTNGESASLSSAGSLFDARMGFGRETRGGRGGPVVHVTTAADDGPGSLRQAVSGSHRRWIVFDGDYTIQSSREIAVGSNKTIDGRGRRVTLTAPKRDGLDLTGSHNVIVENLVLHDFGDVTKTDQNDPFSAIRINSGATDVWIDHCDLSKAGDKLIAIDGGSHNVTVSWNHFHDQEQVFQIGNQTNKVPDAAQTVTIHHNFFDHTGLRNPVVSYGKAHVFDNYLLGWHTYGMRSERNAQLYSEANIFEAGDNRKASVVTPAGNGCNDKKTRCDDSPGSLKSVGDLALNNAVILTSQPEKVFDPHQAYPYRAAPADDSLKQAVLDQVGWRRS